MQGSLLLYIQDVTRGTVVRTLKQQGHVWCTGYHLRVHYCSDTRIVIPTVTVIKYNITHSSTVRVVKANANCSRRVQI